MKKKQEQSRLLEQVKFVKLILSGKGIAASHAIIRYGMIQASNGMLSAGGTVEESELDCCPHVELLRIALETCGNIHQMVQDARTLILRSENFHAAVPTCRPDALSIVAPDPAIAPLGEPFKAALAVVGSLTKESAPTLLQSCVQLDPGACIATSGSVILQAWHGYDMPPGLLVPVSFVLALAKVKKSIVSFGIGATTLTVHFDDHSWLRTTLYLERIPDIVSKLEESRNVFILPQTFYESIDVVAKWSVDERIYVYNDCINSHKPSEATTAYQHPMPGLRQGVSYSVADLRAIAKYIDQFDDAHNRLTMIYGGGVRGAIAHQPLEGK